MKIRSIALLLVATTLAGPALGAPVYPPSGFDLTAVDTSTKPGDDFFQYANGKYLDRSVIPADRPTVSRRFEMTDRMEANLHQLLQQAASGVGEQPSDVKGKAGAFYASYMDEPTIDRIGVAAIAPELDAIRAASSPSELAALMGQSAYGFYPAIAAPFIDADLKAPDKYAIYLNQSGLGMPDRDYYLEPQFAEQRKAYADYAAQLLALIGWQDPAAAAARSAIGFETKLAQDSWDKIKLRDPTTQYNPNSPAELAALAPGVDWSALLKSARIGDRDRLIVGQPDAITRLAATYGATPLDTLKAWMAFRVADAAAPYLPEAFSDARFAFRGKVLQGQAEIPARWKRGMLAVAGGDCGADPGSCFGTFNWGVGQLYSDKYFPAETKQRVQSLVSDLMTAYHKRIEHLDWMGPATRAEALKKLDTYTVKVGYPDQWRDYSNLVIRRDDLLGNVRRAAAADWQFYVDRSRGADKADWGMTPQTNDAYNGSLRDIVFPAGILQAPIFDANADPAYNYGAIGGVIGHELTHGFDDQGRTIDAAGALRDWWTPKDAAEFKRRAKMLGDQYAQFEPVPGVHIKPDLTMGENIADLGGLTLGLDAYHELLHGRPAPVVDGFTGDQRVFLGWAQAWAGKMTPEAIRNLTTSDPHSYRKYRVNGVVRNIDAWYAAFGVKPGDAMYIPPEKRARIW